MKPSQETVSTVSRWRQSSCRGAEIGTVYSFTFSLDSTESGFRNQFQFAKRIKRSLSFANTINTFFFILVHFVVIIIYLFLELKIEVMILEGKYVV